MSVARNTKRILTAREDRWHKIRPKNARDGSHSRITDPEGQRVGSLYVDIVPTPVHEIRRD